MVALSDRAGAGGAPALLRVDVAARADLFEGYAPTVLAVDAAGTVVARRFVYADTDLPERCASCSPGPGPPKARRAGYDRHRRHPHHVRCARAARPSAVVARLRGYRPSRRTVLRALVLGAAATTLVPLDWYLSRRQAAAEPSDRSEYGTCKPAQYDQEANNWWEGGEAVCYGGWRRGSYPCEDGYHREGTFSARGVEYDSTRLTTNCHGRNAWRWKGFRCSDAVTTAVFDDGTEYTGVTIAACALTAQEVANPIPEEPDDEVEEDSEEDSETEDEDSGSDDDSHALVPGLGR